MDEIIKARWVAALRSGEYKQATKIMRNGDSFCCLGVLCDLHSKETGTEWELEENWIERFDVYPKLQYMGQWNFLPEEVIQWAGLDKRNPFIRIKTTATIFNDAGVIFEKIADMIEENL